MKSFDIWQIILKIAPLEILINTSKHMKKQIYYIALLAFTAMLSLLPLQVVRAEGDWQKTIIISTTDGTTMEYIIDENTKVRVVKPDLVIETEGVTINYELEKMAQIRYGKKSLGIQTITPEKPFSFDNEILYFSQLPSNTLIEVFAPDGKLTISRRCNGNAQLSLNSFSPGAYIVKVNATTYKIVKK